MGGLAATTPGLWKAEAGGLQIETQTRGFSNVLRACLKKYNKIFKMLCCGCNSLNIACFNSQCYKKKGGRREK